MSSRIAALKLTLSRAVLVAALPTACAVGVTQEDPGGMTDPVDTAGSSSGGKLGMSGSTTALPKGGMTGSAGSAVVSPFGGTASSGGKAGSSSGGTGSGGAAGSGGKAGSSSGGTGSGGAAGGSTGGAGGSTGGTGTGGCACPTKKTWADNTTLAFGPGDCLDVAGAVYLYTGTKAQTWANKDCNPTMQAAWCSDVGADYKFMLCK
jgi:hypothetical protein